MLINFSLLLIKMWNTVLHPQQEPSPVLLQSTALLQEKPSGRILKREMTSRKDNFEQGGFWAVLLKDKFILRLPEHHRTMLEILCQLTSFFYLLPPPQIEAPRAFIQAVGRKPGGGGWFPLLGGGTPFGAQCVTALDVCLCRGDHMGRPQHSPRGNRGAGYSIRGAACIKENLVWSTRIFGGINQAKNEFSHIFHKKKRPKSMKNI